MSGCSVEFPWKRIGDATYQVDDGRFNRRGDFSARRQCQRSAQDEPDIVVEAGASEIFAGESVDYSVEIRNVKNPAAPDLSALCREFDVVAAGDESHNQSSTFIFNGKVTQQNSFGHTYRFRLTPRRTGKLVIPAPTATVDGKTISGRAAVTQRHRSGSSRRGHPRNQDRSENGLSHPAVRGNAAHFVRPLPDNPDRDPLMPLRRRPPHIDVNWVDLPEGLSGDEKARWLEKLLSQNDSGFTLNDVVDPQRIVFRRTATAVFSFYQGRESRKGLDGRTVNYFVYELKRKVTPSKAGTFAWAPQS